MMNHRRQWAPSGLLAGAILSTTAAAQVSGTVVDASTMAPVRDAIVSLQATTERAETDVNGAFSLPNATGPLLTIVAAKKGRYNGSVQVSGGSSGVVIMLEAVPQTDDPNYAFVDASTCGGCHPDQLSQWTGSPMNKAGTNLWVYDIYDGTGTAGGLGGFVYTRDSVFKDTNPNSECAACHQPEPWIMAPHTALEDITMLSQAALHGVSCDVCHKFAHIDRTKVNFPGIYPGVVDMTRPGPTETQIEYGVLGDTSFELASIMRPSYQPQLTSTMCAACHQDKNDPDEDGDFEEPNGVISEPTYLEWLATPYADPSSPLAATCVDCHMPSYGATHVAVVGSAPARDPETIRSHRVEGTTPAYLDNAVTMTMQSDRTAGVLTLDVDVTNDQTGHHVPTGVTVRNMILLVEAWETSTGQPLVQTSGEVVHALGGVGSSPGDYAGRPGKLYAKHNHDASGNGPTFFTDATGILFDNRIHALQTDSTSYTFAVPPGTGAVQARARLIYRRAFRFLTLAKGWTVDGHGNSLEDVQPPYYGHLMEEVSSFFDCNGNGVEDGDDIASGTSCDADGNGVPDECEGDDPVNFCQGKQNSLGCVPFVSSTGYPSASCPNPFRIEGNDLVPGEAGFLLYGKQPGNLDFHGGKLCVKTPFQRLLPPKVAKATGQPPCSGKLTRDFNKRIQSGADPSLSVGATVYVQWYGRDAADPSGFGDSLTGGLSFQIAP